MTTKNSTPRPGQNTGVIIVPPAPSDFHAGAETGIAAVTLEPTGNWSKYLPDEESQWRNLLDSFACVSFSAANSIETLLNRAIAKKTLPAEHLAFLKNEGYIDPATNKVNVSDRFIAKSSGTTKNGNSLPAVGDALRHKGAVPEVEWPWPDMDDTTPYEEKWSRYYAEIPEHIVAKGKRFAALFDVQYQWVLVGTYNAAKLQEALPAGPVQIAAAVCSPWNSTEGMQPIQGCGCGTQHATTIYGRETDGSWNDFDHYKSYRKLLASNYCIPYALQYAVTAKTPEATDTPTSPTVNLAYGYANTPPVNQLQSCLQAVKDSTGTPYMKPGVFGPYGPQTRTALGRFQTDHGIKDMPVQGTHYGPQTRKALTAALTSSGAALAETSTRGTVEEITPSTMTTKTYTNEDGVKMIEIIAPYAPLAKRVAVRFARGFVAGAVASLGTIIVAAPTTLQEAQTILAAAFVAVVIGGLTGGFQALDKYIRESTTE